MTSSNVLTQQERAFQLAMCAHIVRDFLRHNEDQSGTRFAILDPVEVHAIEVLIDNAMGDGFAEGEGEQCA